MNIFRLRTDKPKPYGTTVRFVEGPRGSADVRCIHMSDEAFSFVEPILKRRSASYHPDTRWGVAEIQADVWRPTVGDLRAMAHRLEEGEKPSSFDVAWIHQVCADEGVEIDARSFLQQIDNPASLESLREFLIAVAGWIEDGLLRHDVLTIEGY